MLYAQTGKDIPVAHSPAGYVIDLHWHKGGRYLGFSLDSVRSPSDAYALDTQTMTVERWTSSEKGAVNTDSLGEPKIVKWKSFDGRSISGFLYRPLEKFAGKRPVIIDIHGGPEDQFQPYHPWRNNDLTNERAIVRQSINGRWNGRKGCTPD
jgi:dipeptidyl aminopeptidase/acylaminoacyl peptidase